MTEASQHHESRTDAWVDIYTSFCNTARLYSKCTNHETDADSTANERGGNGWLVVSHRCSKQPDVCFADDEEYVCASKNIAINEACHLLFADGYAFADCTSPFSQEAHAHAACGAADTIKELFTMQAWLSAMVQCEDCYHIVPGNDDDELIVAKRVLVAPYEPTIIDTFRTFEEVHND